MEGKNKIKNKICVQDQAWQDLECKCPTRDPVKCYQGDETGVDLGLAPSLYSCPISPTTQNQQKLKSLKRLLAGTPIR